jgi:hypothetical protein
MESAGRIDDNRISFGGTGKGSDSALVLTLTNSKNFLDLTMKEVLCKADFWLYNALQKREMLWRKR